MRVHRQKPAAAPTPAEGRAAAPGPGRPEHASLQALADRSPTVRHLRNLGEAAQADAVLQGQFARIAQPAGNTAADIITVIDAVTAAHQAHEHEYDRYIEAVRAGHTGEMDLGSIRTAADYLRGNFAALAPLRGLLAAAAPAAVVPQLPNFAAEIRPGGRMLMHCRDHLNQLRKVIEDVENWIGDAYPLALGDLAEVAPGSELPTEQDYGAYRFGGFNGAVYKYHTGRRELELASHDEAGMYRKYLQREAFREDYSVPGEDAPLDNAADFNLAAALTQADSYTFTRVVSAGEAAAIEANDGHAMQKAGEAKWFTIGGGPANISSSGDASHSRTVVWTLSAPLRRFMLDPTINKYDENETLAADMQEPYIRWRHDEAGNVAFSYRTVAVFNTMVTSCRIDGREVTA